jgi:tRNA(Arg) A34 adenosine deaminase TadA
MAPRTTAKEIDSFLTRAARVALKTSARGDGGPFGAVIVHKDGRVLATTSNSVLRHRDPTRHAEMNAIRRAARALNSPFLQDCDVYSTTEPCPMCFAALHWARVRSVTYATTISDVQKLGFNELAISNERMKAWGKSPLKIIRVKNDACRDLLLRWKKNPRRETY